MGRNPKIRINFDADVQYLLRLKHAIEEDREYPQDFRNDSIAQIEKLIFVLMRAPKKGSIPIVEATPVAPKKRARG